MAKSAADLIASIQGAKSLDELYSSLGNASALKNPQRERFKRIAAIPERYGPDWAKWPADVKAEYDQLCHERDEHAALLEEQFQFERKKRL